MYELIKVGGSTYYMSCPTNIGFFVYGENKCCMIDAGIDKSSAKKALGHINEMGLTLEKLICTHSHADHTGACSFIKERTGCEVYAPGACAAILSHSELLPTTQFGGFCTEEMRSKFLMPAKCDCKELREDDLPAGMEFVHLDGHDFEQIALKTPDGVWFTADATVDEKTLEKYKIAFLYDVKTQLSSLEKLKTLEGKLFIPSHSEPLESIFALAETNIKNIHSVAEIIKELCKDGLSADELIEKIFSRFGIKLYITQYLLIAATTRSYLSMLYEAGEIKCEFEGSRLLWKTA